MKFRQHWRYSKPHLTSEGKRPRHVCSSSMVHFFGRKYPKLVHLECLDRSHALTRSSSERAFQGIQHPLSLLLSSTSSSWSVEVYECSVSSKIRYVGSSDHQRAFDAVNGDLIRFPLYAHGSPYRERIDNLRSDTWDRNYGGYWRTLVVLLSITGIITNSLGMSKKTHWIARPISSRVPTYEFTTNSNGLICKYGVKLQFHKVLVLCIMPEMPKGWCADP